MGESYPAVIQHSSPPPWQETGVLTESVGEDEAVDLQDCLRVIRQHRWLITLAFFGTILATALVLFMTTPMYTIAATEGSSLWMTKKIL